MDLFDPFGFDDNPPPPGGLLTPALMGGAPTSIMSSSPSPLLAPQLNPPSPDTSSEIPPPMETAPDSDIAAVQSGFTSTSPNIQWPSTQGSAKYSSMGDLFSTQHSYQSYDVTSPGESAPAQDGLTISTPVYNYETASFEEPPQKPIRNSNSAEENFANFDEAVAPADVIPSNFEAGLVDNNKVGKLVLGVRFR